MIHFLWNVDQYRDCEPRSCSLFEFFWWIAHICYLLLRRGKVNLHNASIYPRYFFPCITIPIFSQPNVMLTWLSLCQKINNYYGVVCKLAWSIIWYCNLSFFLSFFTVACVCVSFSLTIYYIISWYLSVWSG